MAGWSPGAEPKTLETLSTQGIVPRKMSPEHFKAFVESESYATGAWRGTVPADGHVGTPGVEQAAASRGDDGKAGVTGKAVAAGVGVAAAAAAVAAGAAVAAKKSDDETVHPVPAPGPDFVSPEPVATGFDATEPAPAGSLDPVQPVQPVEPVDPTTGRPAV